eukprot:g4587.t1
MLNFDKAFSKRTGEVITGGGTALPGEDLEIVRQEVTGLSGPTRAAASASAGIFGSTSFASIRGCTADFESEDEQTPAAVEKQTPTPVAVEKASGVAGSMKKEKPTMKKQNPAVAKKKSLPEKPSTGHERDVGNESGAGNAVKTHAQAAAEEAGGHSEDEGDKKFHELSFAEQMERVLNSNIQPKKRVKPPKVPKKADKKDEDAAPDAEQAKREELLARREREQKVLAETTTASKLQILVSDKKSAKEFFADDGFSAIGDSLLDSRLVKQLEFLTFTKMTSIQAEAVPQCLANSSHDVLLKAPTGSGKTLAFLVPALNKILTAVKAPFSREEGVLGVVLSPTKELSNQSMQVCEKLTRMLPWLVCGSLSGGENPKSEKARIRKGLHLVFATPGRLNYHLENTHSWKVSERFQCFVLDEADRLLDMGFEKQIKMIYKSVVKGESSAGGPNFSTSAVGGNPNYAPIGKGNKPVAMASRQTMLVSATLTPAVQRLAEWCLDKEKRLIIGFGERAGKSIANAPAGDLSALVSNDMDDEVASWSLPANLTQHVLVTPTKTRLPCLISLLLKHSGKVIVFFSSCASVDFHYDLFVGLKWPQSMKKDTDKQETKTFRGGFVGLKRDADDDSEEEFVNSDDEGAGAGIVDADNEQDGKAKRPVKKKQRRNYAGGNSTSAAQQETGFIGKKASSGGNADDVGMLDSSNISTTRPNAPIHSSANPKAAKSSTPVFEQIGLFKLHGNLTADERTGFLKDFAQRDKAVLLASDVVARGIDLPKIEYIVQYDPPQHLEEYLHRIGRTARCGNSGNSVLFLQPSEEVYLQMLQQKIDPTSSSIAGSGDAAEHAGVDVWRSGDQGSNVGKSCATSGGGNGSTKVVHRMSCEKLKFNLRQFAPLHFQNLKDCAEFLQSQMIQGAVDKSRQLSHLARRAFLSWMKAYSTFPRALKPVFNVKALHPGHVATSFGLSEAPREIAAHYRKDSSMNGGGGEDAGGKKGGKKGKGKEVRGGSFRDSFGAEGKGGGKKGGKGFSAKKPTLGERLAEDKKQRHGDALREQRNERLFVRKEKVQKGTGRGSGGGSLKGMDSFC